VIKKNEIELRDEKIAGRQSVMIKLAIFSEPRFGRMRGPWSVGKSSRVVVINVLSRPCEKDKECLDRQSRTKI
jgi:hypothetical protein